MCSTSNGIGRISGLLSKWQSPQFISNTPWALVLLCHPYKLGAYDGRPVPYLFHCLGPKLGCFERPSQYCVRKFIPCTHIPARLSEHVAIQKLKLTYHSNTLTCSNCTRSGRADSVETLLAPTFPPWCVSSYWNSHEHLLLWHRVVLNSLICASELSQQALYRVCCNSRIGRFHMAIHAIDFIPLKVAVSL